MGKAKSVASDSVSHLKWLAECTNDSSVKKTNTSNNHRAFLIFEGGGAKGIAHIGALQAVEEFGVTSVGYAGTSAGAIIASLAAAGFSAPELADFRNKKTIFQSLGRRLGIQSPTKLIGRANWFLLKTLGHLVKRFWFLVIASLGVILSAHLGLIDSKFAVTTLAVWIALVAWGLSGLVSLNKFISRFDKVLATKVIPAKPERGVTFGDLRRAGRPPLKIVSANISRKREEVFSSSSASSADVQVARAVAASICIPFVFKSVSIKINNYVDGGIVSNLPAWVFEEEWQLDREIVTIAISVGDPKEPKRARVITPPSCLVSLVAPIGRVVKTMIQQFQWLKPFLGTALFGSEALGQRIQGALIRVPVTSELGLLEFDVSMKRGIQQVSNAWVATSTILEEQLGEGVEKIYRINKFFLDLVDTQVRNNPSWFMGAPNVDKQSRPSRIRVSLALRHRDHQISRRRSFPVGFLSEDRDHELTFPDSCFSTAPSNAGAAKLTSAAGFVISGGASASVAKQLRKSLWSELEWVAVVPVRQLLKGQTGSDLLARQEWAVVVLIESNIKLVASELDNNSDFLRVLDRMVQKAYSELVAGIADVRILTH